MLLNNSKTACYSNAGLNALFASPLVTKFLHMLPVTQGLLRVVQGLARAVLKTINYTLDLHLNA